MPLQLLAGTLVVAGFLLHLYPGVFNGSFSAAFYLYSCLPYMLAALLLWLGPSPWQALCAGITTLIIDLLVFGEVFVWPHRSTAALALIFLPLWQLFLFAPLGALVGHLVYGVLPEPSHNERNA